MITELLPADGLILCAVSGGVDSMYLLCRLREMGFRTAAAHFNHGIRGAEADRDERFVEDFCREKGILFIAGRGDVPGDRHGGESLEEAARRLRYAFLEQAADELSAKVIATAHNADDNAETILLNITRGSGLRGLCGIPPVRGRIVRPMLDVTRAEAEAWLTGHGIAHVEDSTNAEDDYARNRIRHMVMPVLRQQNSRAAENICRMTERLRQDEDCLRKQAEAFIAEYAVGAVLPTAEILALHPAVSARVVRIMAGSELSAAHTKAIMELLRSGGRADLPGISVTVSCGKVLFGSAPCARIENFDLFPGQELAIPGTGLLVRCEKLPECPPFVHSQFTNFFFKCEKIYDTITIGSYRNGDAFRPLKRNCTKTLHRLFIDEKIPVWERASLPVIRDSRRILGVYGFGMGEEAAAVPGDKEILKICFFRTGSESKEVQDCAP